MTTAIDLKKMTKTEMRELHERAEEAGRKAAEAAVPTPMHVVQRADPLDDTSPVVKRYAPVMAGVCGFAWVTIRPGNSRFANWLKKNTRFARRGYYGGCELPVMGYQQSYERKMAYATAYADVLREVGIEATPGGRLD